MSLIVRRARPDNIGIVFAPISEFCKPLGAELMDEWTLCKVTGTALSMLAGRAP